MKSWLKVLRIILSNTQNLHRAFFGCRNVRQESEVIPKREELALSISEAEWSWLRVHMERGGVILVDDSLDLADTAMKVANDNTEIIQQLVNEGKIGKPNLSQLRMWDADKNKRFAMLIVSPFVLIQERIPLYH